jgi:predicted metal-dependent enzyme (double-stranded beta helix superfamily)
VNPIHPALAPLARAASEMPFEDCADVLRAAVKAPAWLRPEHRVGDPARYMRHVLYVDPQDRFVITAITWLSGQTSSVHGHQVWCAYGIAEGELTEERFQESFGTLNVTGTYTYKAGEVAERDLAGKAIHRVSNRSRSTIVSLHLYGVSAERLTIGINRIYAATNP